MAATEKKEENVITWIQWDDPPIFILSGPFVGQGLLDVTQKVVSTRLRQYIHKTIEGTVPRVLKEGEKKSPICNAGWLDTPQWGKIFYFSKPVFVIPSNGILISSKHVEEVAKLRPYSLQKFLDAKPNWKLGVGRLYGEGIDEVLFNNNYTKNPKIITISTSLKVHEMLHSDRIQYTLGYPFEAVYYNKLLKSDHEVEYLPLTDNAQFVNVVVACPKTDWGKKVIEDVNKVLQDPKVLDEIKAGVDRWLIPRDRDRLTEPRRAMREKFYK